MSYQKHNFESKQVLTAQALNEIEDGIVAVTTEVSGKLDKNHGAANVGKILVVGTDGNLILADMPEGGCSGDVIGTLDESNNILLSGNLADGTYTLKYENTDGTYTEIGNLVVNNIPEAEPAIINWIEEVGYIANTRLSLSSGNTTAATDYECTDFIPAKINDVIRVKNIDLTNENSTNIVFYDSSKNPIACNGTYHGTSLANFFATSEGNGVYIGTIKNNSILTFNTDVAYIRIGSKSITNTSILTVNQSIVFEYTNLAEPNTTNTTDTSIWTVGYQVANGGTIETSTGRQLTNKIYVVAGDTVRIKNWTPHRVGLYKADGTPLAGASLSGLSTNAWINSDYVQNTSDMTLTIKDSTTTANVAYIRFSGTPSLTANDVIITVNQEITE